MFSSIGWGEIFFILIIGLIVIGPERLPSVVEDVRAAIYAAKKAINNAKAELNGELGEFEEFKKPIDTVSRYAAMGPKRAMAKVLFEDEEPNTAPTPKPPQQKQARPEPRDSQPERKGFSWEDVI
ncbi:Sec-independent protein translocase protein TatB [Corynebacterium coyleae]|uniref:Sec-independent protein translocase protein TatB n=1 Tax=Corynebacterium coyleae TaxID=53374 RepID=UPI00254E5B28|nr:Sec-independent protein translocase protein TatB [Corynebacterium coyleae]MDK8241109.1 Sec-independent protein translocase protein TatB [Corynebacterium coyleae]